MNKTFSFNWETLSKLISKKEENLKQFYIIYHPPPKKSKDITQERHRLYVKHAPKY